MVMLASTMALVRANAAAPVAALKWYFTVTAAGAGLNNNAGAGLADNSVLLTNGLGTSATSWGLAINNGTGFWQIQNGLITPVDTTKVPAQNDIINIAWDPTGQNLFLGINGTYYNSSGVSTGSTPTSPSLTGVTGTLFQIGASSNTNDSMTLNSSPGSPPAGFTIWAGGSTWNPSDKDSHITLTGSNLIANRDAGGGSTSMVRGTVSKT